MSTKLKLLGVHVSSFGDDEAKTLALVYHDPFSGIYKKYIFTKDGKRLLGGMMVGDTNDYARLLALVRSGSAIRTHSRGPVIQRESTGCRCFARRDTDMLLQ